MSEESINGCIQHKDIRHYRTYHDYMLLYKNEHKAKIIRILETWTDTKRAAWYKEACTNKEQGQLAPEPDFWITMSFRQFRNALYETIGVDTIKQTLDELVGKDKHVERRLNPEVPYGPPQYRLNIPVLQKALNKLPVQGVVPDIPAFEEDTPQGKTYPPGKGTPPPGVSFTPTQGGNVPPPRGETYPQGRGENTPPSNNSNKNHGKNHPKGDTSNGDTASADRPPAPSLSSALSALLDSWHNGDAEEQRATLLALAQAGIVPANAPTPGGDTPMETSPNETPSHPQASEQLSPSVDNSPSQLPTQQLQPSHSRTTQATATTTSREQEAEIPENPKPSESPRGAKQTGCHSDGDTTTAASYSQHSTQADEPTDKAEKMAGRGKGTSRGKGSKQASKEPAPGQEKPAKKASGKREVPDLFAGASPLAQAVITEWRGIFKQPVSITKTLVEHAETLAGYQPEPGEIVACRLWMYKTDENKWYTRHGMHLGDVAGKFERFRSIREAPEVEGDAPASSLKEKRREVVKQTVFSSFDDPDYRFADEFYPSEHERNKAHAAG